jgi:hypothetical protein
MPGPPHGTGPPPEPVHHDHLSDGIGFAIGFALLYLVLGIIAFTTMIQFPVGAWLSFPLFTPGVVQLLWLVPLWRRARRNGRMQRARGFVIGGVVVALLNSACWGCVALVQQPPR